MIKKIFIYIASILMAILIFLFIAEKYLISDCPKFLFKDIEFEICTQVQNSSSVHIIPVDTIKKEEVYTLLIDPIFIADYDTTRKWLNICMGAEEITFDSINKIELFVINKTKEHNITELVTKLASDSKIIFNQKEVDYNRSLLSFKNFYNELNNGYGDFYHSLFEQWAFEFKVGKNSISNGKAKFLLKISFTNGKMLEHSKIFQLKD